MNTTLHPKFVYDEDGHKIEAILPIEEYYNVVKEIMDIHDADVIQERIDEPETDFNIDELKAERELKNNGKN